ncbi:MAG: tRNA (adenosine(37)-N6)-threonylcarbamoyltransferase complex transferase subunit TsaD [bacterium]
MKDKDVILGIETSCDDTSIALVDRNFSVLGMETVSQDSVHKLFGGVIPEIAARNHIAWIIPAIHKVMEKTDVDKKHIKAVAVTTSPGLVGSLLVGTAAAKGLCSGWNIPLISVNHLHGHIYSAFLNEPEIPREPFLSLVVSGGHTSLISVKNNTFRIIGETMDDAAGEAFDKVAKMIGLPYPGGPAIDAVAKKGRLGNYKLPRLLTSPKYRKKTLFSFSGMKTAVKKILSEEENISVSDLMAEFQDKVTELIERKLELAITLNKWNGLVVAGGVSANSVLRKKMQNFSKKHEIPLYMPELKFCGDNGAMIAAAAFKRYDSGSFSSLDCDVSSESLN